MSRANAFGEPLRQTAKTEKEYHADQSAQVSNEAPRHATENEKATDRTRTDDLRFTKPLPGSVSSESASTYESGKPDDSTIDSSCAQQTPLGSIEDPALAAVAAAWPSLPDDVKAAVALIVRNAVGSGKLTRGRKTKATVRKRAPQAKRPRGRRG